MKNLLLAITVFVIWTASASAQKRIVVAKTGPRDFSTVQEALDAVPAGNTTPYVIFIKKGIYKEPLVVDARKSFVVLLGEDKDSTVLTYDNHAGTRLPNGDTLNTWTCASTVVYANDFSASNLTFSNTAGFTAGQAVGLRIEGNRAIITNCNIVGNQDILFLSGSGVKHYFRDCYIEGTTDFIFGAATAVFKNCHIHSKKNSHVTAASTNSIIPYGFVFFDCKLTADTSINKVSLGRPWSPTASVTYINCWMDKHIIAEGWNNWKNPANELTARFAEYNSTGPGANAEQRVKWSKQLTEEEAKKYTIENIFGSWNPEVRK
jgi:pectinesterase